jgi:threonine/homoserine/homoserine lactone efflux protein
MTTALLAFALTATLLILAPGPDSLLVMRNTLGLWFIVETGAWLLTLAWMVARGVSWLRGPAAQRRVERVTAVVLIGFGLRLAAEAR